MNDKMNFSKYNITESSFRFVQSDGKISDDKLSTKRTSFSQDAFRRFCKNKSSVVGAIVLGVLVLLSLLVPLFSPHAVDVVSAPEAFLEPKLFNAGTGFWDGTRRYEKKTNLDGSPSGVIYDRVNETPAGFYKNAVFDLTVDEQPTLINTASQYGSGGYIVLENQKIKNADGTPATVYLATNGAFALHSAGKYTVSVEMNSQQAVFDGKLGEYRVYLSDGTTQIVLKDWSTDYSSYVLDLSKALTDNGLTDLAKAKLYFELKGDADQSTFVLIKKCVFDYVGDDEATDFTSCGFSDATQMILIAKDAAGNIPDGYWVSNGRKGIFASEVYYCSFTYDTYEVVYGEREVTYTASELRDFRNSGLCDYSDEDPKGTFKKLSDECPISEISTQSFNSRTGMLMDVTAMAPNYLKLGYKSMPKFLLGTDASGIDVFTRMFTGLQTSMILGVCTATFCFLFGLVWGSVSGYFGGTVDICMERFCDILGGVPWIVVMTLAILHLGNNFFTFFLALCMTGWMGTAARTRTQFYRFKGSEYVLASRTLGAGDMRLIFKHILPNSLGTIVTSSVLMIVSTIYSESTLAYLNLGLQGVQAFGVMLADNQQYIQSYPYLIVFPSVIMALLMISFNLFGNGLRDALNPILRGAEE